MSSRAYQSYQGPSDPNLRHSEIEGYQPVSRIGECVINSFVDSYEFTALQEICSAPDADGVQTAIEYKPHFHEWATALPGMICVSRKARNATFRNYVSAETATPVIACSSCLFDLDQPNFYFAGVCRSKSVRSIDDGRGPSEDEFFTLAIGGMCTLLNNSGSNIFPGDMLEWSFESPHTKSRATPTRGTGNPRRITVKIATAASERVIGRALSFSKANEPFDLILKSC